MSERARNDVTIALATMAFGYKFAILGSLGLYCIRACALPRISHMTNARSNRVEKHIRKLLLKSPLYIRCPILS